MTRKPLLTKNQIWNLNFGFLGLQVCFSLVMANTSRILSALGAHTDELASLWLVAPLSGLFLQPIIGYLSDKTWTPLGRRIPYIIAGVIITALMMVFMANSQVISSVIPPVLAGVCILFFMQSALNVAMQPYRSLVGDMTNAQQNDLGFSVQTFFSNAGSIIGSLLPFLLALWGISNISASSGDIPPTVIWSFYISIIFLIFSTFRTCFSTKEYPPHLFDKYNEASSENQNTDRQKSERKAIRTLLQISVVQFFSWFAFYYIWVYTTDSISSTIWHTQDSGSEGYNDAGNWFGVLTGAYSLIAAIFSIILPQLTHIINRKALYFLSLFIGGISMISLYYINNQYMLLIPMIGIGISWAMILTMPFSILSNIVPPKKMGLYMGLLNITIVIPQIIAGLTGNYLFKTIAEGEAILMLVIAGISLIAGSISTLIIKERRETL